MTLTSADKSFGLVAVKKGLMTKDELGLWFQDLLLERSQNQSPLAIEDFMISHRALTEDDIDRVLRTRQRHARLCTGCGQFNFLLPKQRSAELPCEYCGGALRPGRLDLPKAPPPPPPKRSGRLMQTLRFIAGFNDSHGSSHGLPEAEPAEVEPEPECQEEEYGDPGDQGNIDFSGDMNFWSQVPKDEDRPVPVDDLGFRSHADTQDRPLRDSEREPKASDAEPAPQGRLARWTTRFKKGLSKRFGGELMGPLKKRITQRLSRPKDPTPIKGSAGPPTAVYRDFGLKEESHTWGAWCLALIAAPVGAAAGAGIAYKSVVMLGYWLSPHYNAPHESEMLRGDPVAMSMAGILFADFMLILLPVLGLYMACALVLSWLEQWPIRGVSLRLCVSIIAALAVFMAMRLTFNELPSQGWVKPQIQVTLQLLALPLSYRIAMGALNRTWDNLNDRL